MSVTKNSNTGYLHNLCSRGAVKEITKFLRESLSSANQLEERVGFLGYTPLHEATHGGHVSVVRLLLLYGANPNTTANGFYTCLHMAASMDNEECVKELIKHGANIESQDEFRKTPYETAVIHRCRHTAKLLKSAEIKKMAKDNDPRLRETVRNLKPDDISPTCLQEALEIACQRANVNAINYIILADEKETLKLKDCIQITLKFNYVQALSVLLVCYGAHEGHVEMLRYLLGLHQTQQEKDTALVQLPHSKACHSHINDIRSYLKDKEIFNVAVPIKIAIHKKHKNATRILLLCTNCDKNTRQIDWRKLGLHEIDHSWFKDIRWAEKLFLLYNMLTTIPGNVIDLHKLCRLDLQNNQLTRIPSGLLKMNCLRTLNLSCNKLTELPKKCDWSPSLNTLDLSDNLLDSLPKNMGRAKLRTLSIARNSFYDVPACVCEILTLGKLDLSGNRNLRELPKEMGRLTEIYSLKLDNLDQVTDPPDEIKKNGTKTIMYLRAKLRSSKGYYSMKLMLVGRAAQGKTTLMHRLMLDYNYNLNSCTNGISMEEFRLRKDIFHKEYVFKVWDFGGQEDYYATHQCFLSTLSLYILVWNLEEGEEGIAKLEGWLDTISARAPRCSSFIIVGTHLDKIRKDKVKYDEGYVSKMHGLLEQLQSQQKYTSIDFKAIKEVSCALDSREGIEDLRITVYDAAFSMLKTVGPHTVSVMGELIPHSYFLVEELIQNKKEELKLSRKLPIIHRADFEALVSDTVRRDSDDVEDPNDIKDVTNFLNERGIIMHYNDPNQDLQDFYFLDPSWLCDLMARVVTLKEANPHIENGILHRDKFQFIFKDERFPYDNYKQFVRLLNRFQIACSLDEDRLLVPSKLPEEKPEKTVNISLPFVTIKRKHSLPFIPYGFWDRFIARFLYYTEDMLTSGCSHELGPGSPTEYENFSPFLVDKICCKCPLITKDGDLLTTPVSEEGVPNSDDEEDILDEVDNEFALHGVYINGDSEEQHSGVWINGQWFGNAASGSRSDSDVDYSTDEDDSSSYGYGSQSGHYIPRVIRYKDAVYGRNVVKGSAHSKKTKRSDKNSQDPFSQSFNEATFKSASRIVPPHPSKSNSLPIAFPDGSFEDRSDSEPGVQSSPSSGERSLTGVNGGIGSFDDNSLASETSEDPHQSRNIPTQSSSSSSSLSSPSSSGFKKKLQSNHSYDTNSLPDADGQAGSFDSLHGSISSDPLKQVYQSSVPTDAVNGQVAANGDLSNHRHSSTGLEQDSEAVNNDTTRISLPIKTQPLCQEENHQKRSFDVSKDDITSTNPLLTTIEQYLKIEDNKETDETRTYPANQQTEYDTQAIDNIVNASSNDVDGRVDLVEEKSEYPEDLVSSFDKEEEAAFKLPQPVNSKKDELTVKQDHNIKRQSRGSRFFQELEHSDTCPLHSEFRFDQLPHVPTDLRTLVDKKFLHCWRTGICLNHPKLFFTISTKPDPKEEGRVLIETEVSPSRVGRRVLNYIVDHIDTLTREWYPDLSVSDGTGPKVRQFIPCVICERLGLKPNDFSFYDCQRQSSKSDNIQCPNHSGCDLNLHLVCPDIMLQDVDPELLLSEGDIIYNESESSILGKGGFGKVVRGKCRNQLVAIKFFIHNDDTEPLKHYFEARKELNVLRRVRQHPYLISIVGVCLRPLCLVLELAEKGSLQECLFSSLVIHRVVLFRVAYQVADAISYLHSLGVIYRDLKPENVLVWSLDERDDLHVKLIDFGTANFATSTGLISCKGSLGTKAPEMLDLRKEGYTMQVDVYSYAILLYQMVLRKQPFMEIDSEASVNAAVTRGDRPKWRDSPLTNYGFPSLTELMLQSWVSKPTRRPRAEQIAQQVRMPPFQALLGKQPIPSAQSVRHACVVPDTKELWLGCYDHLSNKILIFDCKNLNLKHTFTVGSYQDQPCSLQVQALHHVGELMLIAFRGLAVNILNAYSTSPRHKLEWSIQLNEQVTCIASDESYVYVGMNEGYVRCICKKDFKKHERKRNDRMIKVERHCVLSMVATDKKLWISSSKYISTYFTTNDVMEAFDMESMWYGGPLGMELKPQTQVSNLTSSFEKQSVWSTCRSVLTKWCVEKRQTLSSLDCAPLIQAISNSSSLHESDTCIVCILPVLDTIWLGTAGGYILIFSSEDLRLLTWFHPFGEVRTLSYCVGPGPCGTEQCFVISTGKSVRAEGFGTSNPVVCPLTPERLREVPDEISHKMAIKEPTRSRRRSSESRSTFYQPLGSEMGLMFKCSMLVWEAFPANVFERMEAKSGRCPLVITKEQLHVEIPSDE